MSPPSTRPPRPIPHLRDDVVTLRGLRATDAEAVIQQASEPEMIRWTSVPQPYTRQDAETFVTAAARGWAQGTGYYFAIEAEDRFAGSLTVRVQGAGLAEVGFALTGWARGRGLMSRALRLVIPWAFGQPRIEVLHWQGAVGNWPSRRVAWALGFTVNPSPVAGLLEQRGRRVDGWIGTLRRDDRLRPAHAWLDPARITGDRVVLREHRESDVPRLVEACRDRESQAWLSHLPAGYTATNAHAHLLRVGSDQAGGRAVGWAIADPGTDRLLGEISLRLQGAQTRTAEIGYLAHPDARGRGLTSEAVRLACRHALLPVLDGGLGLNRILLCAEDGNLGSRRVAEKTGFTRCGLDRRAYRRRDGSMADDLRYDLLADELPAVR